MSGSTAGEPNDGAGTDSSSREYRDRDALRKRVFRGVAVQTAALSAAVHLLWAWPRLGDPADPRPYVFLLGGAFTVAVAVATLRAPEYRRLYALGAGTLAAFLLGYVGWYGAATPAALASDPLAIVAKGAELVGVGAFLVLYRLAPPTGVVLERRQESTTEGDNPPGDDEPAASNEPTASDEPANGRSDS
ncbi:hypothetical protein [Halorubrum sp. CBA1229]|uniref:hypothetical protein n=1 Tax=Halorubrum sp. CBA1229 TaxID=1853699 RepID=UPI0020D1DE3C|nr:hypothetical protein [Halorubrum sp. CBA1229]